MWNPGPKIEIPHPENHVLKVFRFRSWKPRVWKSRPQSWDPKSWKPCLENHILKFPRPQSWDLKSWKPCLENHILKFPRSFCLAALPCLSDKHCRWRKTLRKVTADNFLQWVFSDSPDRTRPVTPFFTSTIPGLRSALECPNLISSNSFAHRLGTGNSALRLASGLGGLAPKLRQGRTDERTDYVNLYIRFTTSMMELGYRPTGPTYCLSRS